MYTLCTQSQLFVLAIWTVKEIFKPIYRHPLVEVSQELKNDGNAANSFNFAAIKFQKQDPPDIDKVMAPSFLIFFIQAKFSKLLHFHWELWYIQHNAWPSYFTVQTNCSSVSVHLYCKSWCKGGLSKCFKSKLLIWIPHIWIPHMTEKAKQFGLTLLAARNYFFCKS